jgi:hypothetical protein
MVLDPGSRLLVDTFTSARLTAFSRASYSCVHSNALFFVKHSFSVVVVDALGLRIFKEYQKHGRKQSTISMCLLNEVPENASDGRAEIKHAPSAEIWDQSWPAPDTTRKMTA